MLYLIPPTRHTRVTNSFEKTFSGIKPWGRRPVLGTGSGRFESFIPDLFCAPVVPGSSPGSAALEMIRIGKEFVLKTNAGKIRCRFESMPSPFLLSRRLIGRTPAFEAENLGSSPSNSELWLSSSSLGRRFVVSKTWARIPLATPNAHLGKKVIQLIANQ